MVVNRPKYILKWTNANSYSAKIHKSKQHLIKSLFSKLSIDLFFKLPVSRFLAINIEGKIGELTVRRTSSFISDVTGSHVTFSPLLFPPYFFSPHFFPVLFFSYFFFVLFPPVLFSRTFFIVFFFRAFFPPYFFFVLFSPVFFFPRTFFPWVWLLLLLPYTTGQQQQPSSNNTTLTARLLARVITGCHYT